MQSYILGVDIGTGSVKAVAVSVNGEAIDSSQIHYPMLPTEIGFAEQDVKLIWQGFLNCIQEIIAHLGQPQAISLSSAMHSLILVDAKGKPLTNMINWADTRSSVIADKLRASPAGKNLYEQNGTPVYSMSPLTKIIWFKENRKDLFDQTAKFISIKELIWFRLFGRFQIDHSIASATGLFDILKFCWSERALKLAGISADQLSEPVSTSYLRDDLNPNITKLLGIKEALPWIIGANDGCLANLGSGANQRNTAALTIGTSGAVRMASNKPLYNFGAMTFNYILSEQIYICGGAINNGGLILNWLLEKFMLKEALAAAGYRQLFAAIETLPAGNDGLLFLPYLTGERTPLWDSNSCGTFFGIKTTHTQANFLKAGLDGVCFAICHVLDALNQSAEKIAEIRVSGGFTASPVWMQLMADITGKKLTVVQAEDASAIGAAFLAIKTGKFADFKLKDDAQTNQIIQPNLEKHQVYRSYYRLFVKLYEDLKESMHQLTHLNQHNSN